MLREELQAYFNLVYPYSKIEDQYSLGGQVHIRFELGEEKENATQDRVDQSTERALTIFNNTFNIPTNEIFVLIYEYEGENLFEVSNEYLHKQFSPDTLREFYNELETVDPGFYTTENGNKVVEKVDVRVIIGKLPVVEINIKNILNGIANLEMGFDPGINQKVYFFDPSTDRAFHMYDDRGCYVWSDKPDKIRNIFLERNDWIVDYHRPEIEEYFKQ